MIHRRGLTMIELAVVIMILGIFATIAVPKFMRTAASAQDNVVRSNLATVRNAIELYTADHDGTLPGQGATPNLPADLADYLRGDFPVSPPKENRAVAYVTEEIQQPFGPEGWMYSQATGQFIVNSSGELMSEPGVYYNEL